MDALYQIIRNAATLGVDPLPTEIISKAKTSSSDGKIGGTASHVEIVKVKLKSGHIIELKAITATSSCVANCDFSRSLEENKTKE